MSEPEVCPSCGQSCERDSVDVGIGIGIIYGPWGCPCGWSSDPQYDQTNGPGGDRERGSHGPVGRGLPGGESSAVAAGDGARRGSVALSGRGLLDVGRAERIMTPPSTSARHAAVDAARELLYAWDGRSETELAEVVVARVFKVLAGDLFIDENGVCDGQVLLHLVRDDTTDQLWALLETILPTQEAGEAL